MYCRLGWTHHEENTQALMSHKMSPLHGCLTVTILLLRFFVVLNLVTVAAKNRPTNFQIGHPNL